MGCLLRNRNGVFVLLGSLAIVLFAIGVVGAFVVDDGGSGTATVVQPVAPAPTTTAPTATTTTATTAAKAAPPTTAGTPTTLASAAAPTTASPPTTVAQTTVASSPTTAVSAAPTTAVTTTPVTVAATTGLARTGGLPPFLPVGAALAVAAGLGAAGLRRRASEASAE